MKRRLLNLEKERREESQQAAPRPLAGNSLCALRTEEQGELTNSAELV